MADLEEESKYWITTENLEQKITPELFMKPATTGLVMRHSHLWKYHCLNDSYGRILTGDDDDDYLMASRKLNEIGHKKLKRTMDVAEYLNDMIATGEEREKYEETMKLFIKRLDVYKHWENDDKAIEWVSRPTIIYFAVCRCYCLRLCSSLIITADH